MRISFFIFNYSNWNLPTVENWVSLLEFSKPSRSTTRTTCSEQGFLLERLFTRRFSGLPSAAESNRLAVAMRHLDWTGMFVNDDPLFSNSRVLNQYDWFIAFASITFITFSRQRPNRNRFVTMGSRGNHLPRQLNEKFIRKVWRYWFLKRFCSTLRCWSTSDAYCRSGQ